MAISPIPKNMTLADFAPTANGLERQIKEFLKQRGPLSEYMIDVDHHGDSRIKMKWPSGPHVELPMDNQLTANFITQYLQSPVPVPLHPIGQGKEKMDRTNTLGYNPTTSEGAPANGSDIDLTAFPEHHIAAVLHRATAKNTPENRRIAAYAVGLSLDLILQFMNDRDPENKIDEVVEFRYMLTEFAEWAGFPSFDAWRRSR